MEVDHRDEGCALPAMQECTDVAAKNVTLLVLGPGGGCGLAGLAGLRRGEPTS